MVRSLVQVFCSDSKHDNKFACDCYRQRSVNRIFGAVFASLQSLPSARTSWDKILRFAQIFLFQRKYRTCVHIDRNIESSCRKPARASLYEADATGIAYLKERAKAVTHIGPNFTDTVFAAVGFLRALPLP